MQHVLHVAAPHNKGVHKIEIFAMGVHSVSDGFSSMSMKDSFLGLFCFLHYYIYYTTYSSNYQSEFHRKQSDDSGACSALARLFRSG